MAMLQVGVEAAGADDAEVLGGEVVVELLVVVDLLLTIGNGEAVEDVS